MRLAVGAPHGGDRVPDEQDEQGAGGEDDDEGERGNDPARAGSGPPVAAPSCVSCVRRLSGTNWRFCVSRTHSAAPLAAAFVILIASAAFGPWPKTVTVGCSGSARNVIR